MQEPQVGTMVRVKQFADPNCRPLTQYQNAIGAVTEVSGTLYMVDTSKAPTQQAVLFAEFFSLNELEDPDAQRGNP